MTTEALPLLPRPPVEKAQPLDRVGAEAWMKCAILEREAGPEVMEEVRKGMENDLLNQILLKRIEVFKLPISFTPFAICAIGFMVKSPGEAMLLLIDCLQRAEGTKITVQKLVELYPFGFYAEAQIEDYIDNWLKVKKCKWSEIY